MAENIEFYRTAFANVCNQMAQQDRDLLSAIALPGFVGSVQLDNTRNNAIYLITDFFDILMHIPYGMVQTEDANKLVALNDQLLDAIELRYGCRDEVVRCRQAFGNSKGVWRIRNPYHQIPPEEYCRKLEKCRDDIFTALNALNVKIYLLEAKGVQTAKKRPKTRHRAKAGELTQEDVARDFGVMRQRVNAWESGEENVWGYRKELRTDPNLRDAYEMLVNMVKMYNRAKQSAKEQGKRFRVTFVRFRDEWIRCQKKT